MKASFIFSAVAERGLHGNAIICIKMQQSGSAHLLLRKSLKRGFKKSLMRVLEFAKHETLRKLHRYLHNNRELRGQEHPGASRIAFDPAELAQDLQSMLYSEIPQMLNASADTALESIGFGLPFQMASQNVLDFIATRENLLSGVSDELFQTIMAQLSEGLSAGESIADLSDRIASVFADIEEGRADVIADNEVTAAFNYAADTAARSAGAEFKQWVHGGSKMPREDHLAIDGLVVPIDEPYPVGDPPLMYPHDPNGSPDDVINCSCVSIPSGGGGSQEEE
jgi:uncharacterized protein with gpF-like domain